LYPYLTEKTAPAVGNQPTSAKGSEQTAEKKKEPRKLRKRWMHPGDNLLYDALEKQVICKMNFQLYLQFNVIKGYLTFKNIMSDLGIVEGFDVLV
jgi:hypothetical protein